MVRGVLYVWTVATGVGAEEVVDKILLPIWLTVSRAPTRRWSRTITTTDKRRIERACSGFIIKHVVLWVLKENALACGWVIHVGNCLLHRVSQHLVRADG